MYVAESGMMAKPGQNIYDFPSQSLFGLSSPRLNATIGLGHSKLRKVTDVMISSVYFKLAW